MIWYRLIQDHEGLLEGSTISEDKFKGIGYLSKQMFEPIDEFELKDMIELDNQSYCLNNGVDKLLFYGQHELDNFLTKIEDCGVD